MSTGSVFEPSSSLRSHPSIHLLIASTHTHTDTLPSFSFFIFYTHTHLPRHALLLFYYYYYSTATFLVFPLLSAPSLPVATAASRRRKMSADAILLRVIRFLWSTFKKARRARRTWKCSLSRLGKLYGLI